MEKGRTVRDVMMLDTANELFEVVDDFNTRVAFLETLQDFCGFREGEDAEY